MPKQKAKKACPMQTHIKNLGFSSTKAYKKWCRSHNFSRGVNKNPRQRKNEVNFFNRIQATELLKEKKRIRKEGSFLEQIIRFVSTVDMAADTFHPYPRDKIRTYIEFTTRRKLDFFQHQAVGTLIDVFKDTAYPELLRDTLIFLEKHSILLQEKRGNLLREDGFHATAHAIREIVDDHHKWVRPIFTFRAHTRSPARQLADLMRHLFAVYPVPRFLDAAWRRGGTEKKWWTHIAAGGNFRTAEGLPVPLTKRMAHYLMAAPSHYSIEESFVFAQVCSIDQTRKWVKPMCKKFGINDEAYWHRREHHREHHEAWRMWESFVIDNDFWLNVIRSFSRTPCLSEPEIGLLLDYILYKKYEQQTPFSMKRRSVSSLLRQARAWEQHAGRGNGNETLETCQWKPSEIGGFLYREVDTSGSRHVSWRIRELLSPSALMTESEILSHCVGDRGYAQRCSKGEIAIFTMEVKEDTKSKWKKLITIEVALGDKPRILQCGGLRNRIPTEEERLLIAMWAEEEGLL